MGEKKAFSVIFPSELWLKLKYHCADNRISMNKYITECVIDKLKNYKKPLKNNKK